MNLSDTNPQHEFPGQRQKTYDLFKNSPLFSFEHNFVSREKVWKQHGENLFILSPPGNGLDCHRTWEALILGGIPIVLSTPLDRLYKDLPVVIVRKWEEITEENLKSWRQNILSRQYNMKKLDRHYWISLIEKN